MIIRVIHVEDEVLNFSIKFQIYPNYFDLSIKELTKSGSTAEHVR